MIHSGSLSATAILARTHSTELLVGVSKIQQQLSLPLVALFFWRAGFFTVLYATYFLPPAMLLHTLFASPLPTITQVVAVPVLTVVLISVPMSVCLHRFFSHQAFQTTRAFQFVLAVISCFAYQNGPLWWAGKHNRHHRTCDTPEDPHSWIASGNLLWAWVGWTMHNKEAHYDFKYIPARFKNCPELWVVDVLCYPICALAWLAVYHAWGYQSMVYFAALPMLYCRLLTLAFNTWFHPPPNAKAIKSGVICNALDRVAAGQGFLASVVGEAHHNDHHKHPLKFIRPGHDWAYHMSLRWWMAVGLTWEAPRSHKS